MDEIEFQDRNLEDVKRILGFAKLDNTELRPAVQCLNFVPELDNDSMKLLEMDSNVIGHLQQGQSVIIRGSKTDTAVLCTGDRTYDMRLAETSNVLLLVPECDAGEAESKSEDFHLTHKEVCALKQEYYELREIKPRLKHLRMLLEENVYSGQECEKDDHHQGHKYTLGMLLEEVQASENELLRGLSDIEACHIDGYWRLLEFDYMSKVLGDLLSLKDEQSWSFDEIPASACCDTFQEIYPRNVVAHILRCTSDLDGEPLHVDQHTAETQTYKLSEDKICCFFAKLLLKDVDKFNLKDFTQTWQQAVPEGMNTGLYQLEGTVLVERDTKPEVIRYFPVSNLPEDPAERFLKLFKTKPKWTLEEISPFLLDLCTEKVTVGSLLLKFARASTQNGIKMYSSKRPL